MAELQNGGTIPVRTNQQLRSDIDKGLSDLQGAKDSWAAALQRQERERNAQNGMATYGQMKELAGRQELAELQNGQRAQDAIASALAIASAPENKGRLPRVVTDYLNRQFGFDGENEGIIDGGIDPKTGEFGFVFGERDGAGNVVPRKQMIPLSVQLGLMEGYPSLFSDDAVKAHRQRMLDSGLSSGEVDAYSNVARLARERLAKRMSTLNDSMSSRNGMSSERLQLERDRLAQRKNEEDGRNARAGAKNSGAQARLAASVAQNMNAIKLGLNLTDEQAASFEGSLTKILSDAFSGISDQQTPVSPSADDGASASAASFKDVDDFKKNGGSYKVGDSITIGDTIYKLGQDGHMKVVGKAKK